MASFRANVSGAAPLRIQLTAPASESIRVLAFSAVGETTAGNASRPVLFRPGSVGSGTGEARSLDGTGVTANATVVTAFTITPTNPGANAGSFNLPMAVHVRFSRAECPIIPPGETVVLYAAGNGGHTWMGELEWEEGSE